MRITVTKTSGHEIVLNERNGAILIEREEGSERTMLYAPFGSVASPNIAKIHIDKPVCRVHGLNCPGDSGHMFMDFNHPDDMFGVQTDVL